MKKVLQGLFIVSMVFIMAGCSNKSHPVIIGNLSFDINTKVWKHVKSIDENAPLEFRDSNNNSLVINVSQESTYQHPLTMISFIETLFYENDSFQVFVEPKELSVNDTTWYEYGYQFSDNTTTYKVYQRYYGKFYNAASVSYTATLDSYDAGIDEAIALMSNIKVEEIRNDENEAKAKEFLVGEWDLDGKGYLVLLEDGTYKWYRDGSKNEKNMHYGSYGCDIENSNMNMFEGDAIYLVIFPEGLVVDGVPQAVQAKNDFLISLDNENEGYPMVNIATYSLYTMFKQ
ncbi:MAG: hypothetical protein GX319_03285 [Clostridiales bacterium]|jgi:hypothetical protein|nr:hypothetical protein [Bacillota bacterium]NLK03419.1 hypothetical protein [Clostridiales bacterium]